ncbi:MAG: hypothetical protein K6T90_22695 [Leptolyngbyaceae cyanobacterium HOT.MB2.61]|nr:hypothetical protein [Leptolyngbyaceae cyanobacterium HOT.MB2.61]
MDNPSPQRSDFSEVIAVATAHHQTGRLTQAEQIYRQILQPPPQQVETLNLLRVVACQKGMAIVIVVRTGCRGFHLLHPQNHL